MRGFTPVRVPPPLPPHARSIFEALFAGFTLIQLTAVQVSAADLQAGVTKDPKCQAFSFVSQYTLLGARTVLCTL